MKTTWIAKNVDEYIANYPINIQKKLEEVRATIKKAVPQAEEVISYQMPAFSYKGVLVYFAAQTNHIGLYPTASGVETFKKELANYKTSKGAIQFPHDEPLPLDLITKIVVFRLQENLKKAELKAGKK